MKAETDHEEDSNKGDTSGEQSSGRLSLAPCTVADPRLSDFKSPYDHEEDEEIRKMTPSDLNIKMDKPSGPMNRIKWTGPKFRPPPSRRLLAYPSSRPKQFDSSCPGG